MKHKGLLLFDGDCSFCHRGVQFILKHDTHAYFSFASLQGSTGRKMKAHYRIPVDTDSVILIENNRYYHKSTAILRMCRKLNHFYPVLFLFILIPKPIRDVFYDFIAKNRQWFSKQLSTCILPSPEDQKRFLK